ncbi:MAG: sugar phosphate isomerase/epimerase family protein [Puniceicoccaceae bacterium]
MNARISRRQLLATSSTLGMGFCLSPLARAIEPIVRNSKAPLRLSLAAYSMRKFLPDTRRNPAATGDMDMFGFIDYGATLGIDAVELTGYFMPHPLTDDLLNKMKLRAHLHGLDISGGAIGNNFTSDPGSSDGRAQLEHVRKWVDHYSVLGAPVIRVFGGKPQKGVSEEQAVRNIITNLSIACDYAGSKGVILAIENHDFLTDVDRLLPIVKAVDSPWFGVNFDSGNIASTSDPYAKLEQLAPYAVNAQLKIDIPVNGKKQPANLGRIVKILKRAKYSGYITLEYEGSEDPYKAIPEYLAELRGLI